MLRLVIHLVRLGLGFVAQTGFAAYQLNMPASVSSISQRIYNPHMAVFYVSCVIAAIVFIILIYSLFCYRKSNNANAAQFYGNLTIEIIWTTIPFLIMIGLAIPATKILYDIMAT